MSKPAYVYVASSWRNPLQPVVVEALRGAGIDCYDFRNPESGTGFSWREVKSDYDGPPIGTDGIRAKGSDWEPVDEYLRMIQHPRAIEGFEADFAAMQAADAFVMVLPCGKSAHLELGWAIGAGKPTVIVLEDPLEPELMYHLADYLVRDVDGLLDWMYEQPTRCRRCGCTDLEACSPPCWWVETNLCSACIDKVDDGVIARGSALLLTFDEASGAES